MKIKKQLLVLSTALCIALALTVLADAETVTTKTVTEQSVPPGSKTINLAEFDINKNGILSTFEVGEMLFKLFDTDSNNVIDNMEYENRAILTVVPMEKTTTITYDYDGDGTADQTQVTSETFLQNTQLARFGANPAGLSPREVVDKDFLTADADHMAGIDRTEWKNAYIFKITPVMVR